MFQVVFVLPNLISYEARVFTIPRKGEEVDLGDNVGEGIVVRVHHSIDNSTAGDFHRVTIYLDEDYHDPWSNEHVP